MKVTLVGAGPGGIGLLTLKGLETLQAADVVMYDRFVSGDILAAIPGSAEKFDVGKHAGSHPVPQDAINNLLLEKAMEGKNVVRLKGGDPFVFARGGEELELLAENGIPFEVVPGVTSAVAAAAYAGIPLTHRDYASSFHVITAHAKNNEPPNIDFDALVKLNGTLVFLMGAAAIGAICEGCAAAGMDKDMPAAVVENAAANSRRKFLGTIATLPQIAGANKVESPAVIIIGKVCEFSDRYDWFDRKPLRGRRVVVVSIKYETVSSFTRHVISTSLNDLFSRVSINPTSKLSDALRELGCDVIEMPCLKIVPLIGQDNMLMEKSEPFVAPLGLPRRFAQGNDGHCERSEATCLSRRKAIHTYQLIRHINDYSWLVFTSRIGVNIFFDYLKEVLIDIRKLSGIKTACVGIETEREMNKRGIMVDYVPAEYNGAALARGLSGLVKRGEKLLIARAKDGDKELTNILTEAGIAFDDVPIYEKVKDIKRAGEFADNFDFAAFTSPSAVKGFAETAASIDFNKIKAVCIGEKTASAARAYGMEAYVSTEATIESMVEKIMELNKSK